MTFPKRWLDDDSEAAAPMRDVLRADRDAAPPAGAQDAVWLALAAKVGAGGVGGAGAAGAAGKAAAGASAKAAGGAVGGGILKSIAIGAVSGLLAVGGYSVLSPVNPGGDVASGRAPAATASPSRAVTREPSAALSPVDPAGPSAAPSAPAEARAAVAVSGAPRPEDTAAASAPEASSSADAAGSAAPAPGSPEERASRLREENELLGQARAALRGGDPGGAMRLLEQARQKFGEGVLGQEREALTIEALAKSGAREAASARAAAFIQAHPTSPHAARLQAFVAP